MTDCDVVVRDFLFLATGAGLGWLMAWAYVEAVNAKMESNDRRVEYLTAKLAECQRMAREARRSDST